MISLPLRKQIKIIHMSTILNGHQLHLSERASPSLYLGLTSIFIFLFMNLFILLDLLSLCSPPSKANLVSWERPCGAGAQLRSRDFPTVFKDPKRENSPGSSQGTGYSGEIMVKIPPMDKSKNQALNGPWSHILKKHPDV